MRPRHKAAEIPGTFARSRNGSGLASMRPRHKAAEIGEQTLHSRGLSLRFNEAAA